MMTNKIIGTIVLIFSCSIFSSIQSATERTTEENFIFGDYHQITVKHSNKCLDIYGGQLEDLAAVIQFTCRGGDNQLFYFVQKGSGYFSIVAKHSGKCLDVKEASREDGAAIIQYTCNGGDNQLFSRTHNGVFPIFAKHSGKCLDVTGSSTEDGAAIIQFSCRYKDNQMFSITEVE